jgi:hypothetical protein
VRFAVEARGLSVIRPTQKLLPLLLPALLMATGVFVTTPAAAADAASVADPDKKICSRELKTGTRIPVKVCRTRAEIDAERQATQNAIRSNPSTNNKRGT